LNDTADNFRLTKSGEMLIFNRVVLALAKS
jgi:hypothetical protein